MWRSVFFFNDTATTEIYTLSLHDALPIFPLGVFSDGMAGSFPGGGNERVGMRLQQGDGVLHRLFRKKRHPQDRKSTRLNSSHANISYAVFCLKKKKSILNGLR